MSEKPTHRQAARGEARVVNLRDEAADVYVGRPSPFGNPFFVGSDGSRTEVIAKFEAYLMARPKLMARVGRELKGKTLGCFCAPRACHADILLEVANGGGAYGPEDEDE